MLRYCESYYLMKAYLVITAVVFGLITVAHIWRSIEEGPHLAMQPGFILLTIASAGLCIWAVTLLRRLPRP